MADLFGTDGIRGEANTYPMTPEVALRTGRAIAARCRNRSSRPTILVGKDTRISGDMIETALAAGICSAGADAVMAGVLPTPGVAYLCRAMDACAGIVVSASHNPYADNGIKVFKGDGFKLSDAEEAELEACIVGSEAADGTTAVKGGDIGRVRTLDDAPSRYRQFLKTVLPPEISLDGMRVVADCANGATAMVAPLLFRELGADLIALFDAPDGVNINADCGSQHPRVLSQQVVSHHADVGIAFDGDGDRLIVVDERGQIVSGDQLLAVCARFLKAGGLLAENCVVSTVMSNMGLRIALDRLGIRHEIAAVGDRYVKEKMVQTGAVLGGEDSGHMIFLQHHTTGDGMLAALKLFEIMSRTRQTVSELAAVMTVFPQKLQNVTVREKPEIDSVPEIIDAIGKVERRLGEKGRVLVRYSGTQPVCRVMVEAPTSLETEQYCAAIASVIRETLG